jgi:hypothetical protein
MNDCSCYNFLDFLAQRTGSVASPPIISPPIVNPPIESGGPYIVYVTPADLTTLNQVRTVVPEAFRSVINGTRVIQAGRFSSLALADERVQLLQSSGFNAQRTGGVKVPP